MATYHWLLVVGVLSSLRPLRVREQGIPRTRYPAGYPGSTESPTISADVRRCGVDATYAQEDKTKLGVVSPASRSGRSSRTFRVTDYWRSGDGRLKSGVQLWVDAKTGERLVIRKSFIRVAHQAVMQLGHDLTEHDWIVESIGSEYHFTYTTRPPNPGELVDDGAFTVRVSAKTGKVLGIKGVP